MRYTTLQNRASLWEEMPQGSEVVNVVPMDDVSWSSVGSHKLSAWFASLGSRGRGRRKAAAVAAATSSVAGTATTNNNTTRSFTLGKNKNLKTDDSSVACNPAFLVLSIVYAGRDDFRVVTSRLLRRPWRECVTLSDSLYKPRR